jgi:FtsH-binding integral membrane protein
MSATTPQTQARTESPTPGFLSTRPVWLVGVLATLAGAVVTEAFALVARAAGVPMEAAGPGAKEAAEIPAGGFGSGVVFWSVAGIVLAVVFARFAERPARTFTVTTVVLTALSLAGPVVAPHTATSTQIVLAASHVVAAAVIIPLLARRLSHVRR